MPSVDSLRVVSEAISPIDRMGRAAPVLQAQRRRRPRGRRGGGQGRPRQPSHQVVTAAMLGHKCRPRGHGARPRPARAARACRAALQAAGLDVVDCYVSLTEVSEYAKGMPEQMLNARLYPQLPPEGKPAFCFYPMSKRRNDGSNWFTLPYDERERADARARREPDAPSPAGSSS